MTEFKVCHNGTNYIVSERVYNQYTAADWKGREELVTSWINFPGATGVTEAVTLDLSKCPGVVGQLSKEQLTEWQLEQEKTKAQLSPTAEPTTMSVEATLDQRGKRYGDFSDHARLCQQLHADLSKFEKGDQDGIVFKPWEYLSDVQKQALTVICDKLARIISGDPNYDDNWIDIQGYAKLVQDRLPKETK